MSELQVNKDKLKIIPLGGLEQIGMNMTAFEYGDSIVVVDCGLAFPEDDMLGIDFVIPDVTYLMENISKVKGFVITHGHEDHIGAIPYVFQQLNVPIYTTRLTMTLIEKKLEEHGGNLKRAAVALAQTWRSDGGARNLEAMMLAADKESVLLISGTGEVIEPDVSTITMTLTLLGFFSESPTTSRDSVYVPS